MGGKPWIFFFFMLMHGREVLGRRDLATGGWEDDQRMGVLNNEELLRWGRGGGGGYNRIA